MKKLLTALLAVCMCAFGAVGLDIKSQSYFDAAGAPDQHGGGGFLAYDSAIIGWLFSH